MSKGQWGARFRRPSQLATGQEHTNRKKKKLSFPFNQQNTVAAQLCFGTASIAGQPEVHDYTTTAIGKHERPSELTERTHFPCDRCAKAARSIEVLLVLDFIRHSAKPTSASVPDASLIRCTRGLRIGAFAVEEGCLIT